MSEAESTAPEAGMVTVTYWAAARAAAGVASEERAGGRVRDLLDAARLDHPALAAVLPICAILIDGVPVHDRARVVAPGSRVEVLPPFSGG
jgi:molybdopterin converting factor small subunit